MTNGAGPEGDVTMRAPERWAGGAGTAARRSARAALAVVLLLAGGASRARAQPDDVSALFAPGTVFSVGALSGVGPRFQGANRASLWGLPYLSFRRPGEAPEWWSPDDGLDADLVETGPLRVGPVLDLRDGRSARDTRHVPDLPTVPLTVGLGLFGEVWLERDTLRLRAEVTQGVRAHDGVLIKLAGDAIHRFGRFTLSGGPRLVLADAASQRIDFGVPDRALGLKPYDPRGGPRSAGLAAALAYDWSDDWQTLVYGRYDRLLSAAAASPIVRRFGTVNQLSAGVGAIYSFRSPP
ncbi:MipA/OmpV family protein [Methylobacterium sp. J-068]|uniref:MipA/OmpV family protein n=1 Tax=Methylobacterium sp. J-068 TaxID=2836649 RepID=UPI001FBBE7A1|nr:MipA/OmpV family protein [Methylobacterium sp. J-068]MCJ2035353.1 MipA/OmpV family protein [Methylobacterium sp. J-068]